MTPKSSSENKHAPWVEPNLRANAELAKTDPEKAKRNEAYILEHAHEPVPPWHRSIEAWNKELDKENAVKLKENGGKLPPWVPKAPAPGQTRVLAGTLQKGKAAKPDPEFEALAKSAGLSPQDAEKLTKLFR